MGEYQDKIIAGLLIFGALVFMFFRVSSQPISSSTKGGIADITLEESKRIFAELGGQFTNPPIVMFETDWCPVCRSLETELTRRSIPFVSANIEKNQIAGRYYRQLLAGKRGGVPLTLIGTTPVLGFRMAEIDAAYQALMATSSH